MNLQKESGQDIESKEELDYEITIVVHRHGPKDGIAGPLSSEGEKITEEYFSNAYKGVFFDEKAGGADIEYSPIGRTQKTADIYSNVARKYGVGKIKSSRADERLSEGNIAEHLDLVDQYGGRDGKWIKGWMGAEKRPLPDVKTGQEAAADFAEWLLLKISDRKTLGGSQEVDAFSHGPAMAAFVLKLEEKLGEKIMPENLHGESLFKNILNYLSYMNFHAGSSRPDIVSFSLSGKKVEIPISILREIVRENRLEKHVKSPRLKEG